MEKKILELEKQSLSLFFYRSEWGNIVHQKKDTCDAHQKGGLGTEKMIFPKSPFSSGWRFLLHKNETMCSKGNRQS